MKIPYFLAFLLIFAVPPSFAAERQLLDQVVAVVNDEPITQSELDNLLRPLYEQYKTELKGQRLAEVMAEARKKLLDQLIEDKLVFQEAKTQDIKVDEAEVDAEIDEFKKQFPSEDAMEEALGKEGLSLNDMRERIRRREMIRRIQDVEIRAKVVVSPTEIQDYYEKHTEDFAGQDSLKVRSMTIKKSDEAREKGLTDESAKNKIENLRRKVAGGGNFEQLAKDYSQDSSAKNGGLGDSVRRGDMIAAIDDLIFKLNPGEISQIIETPMGYHFFRVEEKKSSKQKNFSEAKQEIHARLYNEKTRQRFEDWTSELKRNAYISVR